MCDLDEYGYKNTVNAKRIYVGSYFCANYFVNLDLKRIREVLGDEVKLTLVVPILNQRNLSLGKEKIRKACRFFGEQLDEITINEYGLLGFIKNEIPCKLNLGRLLLKDNRDPRVDDFYSRCAEPKGFTQMFVDILRKYNVTSVEIDEIYEKISVTKLPKEVELGVHFPYMYISTGHICEIASNTKEVSKKFRAGDSCSYSCKDVHLSYDGTEGLTYVKLGKGIYVKRQVRSEIITKNKVRTIFMPLEL